MQLSLRPRSTCSICHGQLRPPISSKLMRFVLMPVLKHASPSATCTGQSQASYRHMLCKLLQNMLSIYASIATLLSPAPAPSIQSDCMLAVVRSTRLGKTWNWLTELCPVARPATATETDTEFPFNFSLYHITLFHK